MVPTEIDRDNTGSQHFQEASRYAPLGFFDVARHTRQITVINNRQMLKDGHLTSTVEGAHERRGAADALGAEASPYPICASGIKGDANHGNVNVLKEIHHVGEPGV